MRKIERWKPEAGEWYYFFNMFFEVCKQTNDAMEYNASHFAVGNCFRTQAEAQSAAEKVKALLLSLPDNGNNLVSNLPDKELPKLTAEVFDRPDCPEWAKWAAVDGSGYAYYYSEKPFILSDAFGWGVVCSEKNQSELIPGKFTHINWRDSLVERPAQLPEWVEIGGYVYDARNGYGKIVSGSVKSCYIEFDGGAGDFEPEAFRELKQARPRPYNDEEMKALIGKPITMLDGSVCLCSVYIKRDKSVILDGIHWDARELLDSGYTLDGKPCGKLEHLENGEWME